MTVKDALHQLKLEISENENRKDFSFSEKMEWADKLRDEYSKIAEQKMLSGVKNPSQNSDKGDNLRTDDIVAKEVGLGSRDTYRKAEYIYKNADEGIIEQLNEEKISIHKAWTETKEKLNHIKNENRESVVPLWHSEN